MNGAPLAGFPRQSSQNALRAGGGPPALAPHSFFRFLMVAEALARCILSRPVISMGWFTKEIARDTQAPRRTECGKAPAFLDSGFHLK